jgi:hypothetical protein
MSVSITRKPLFSSARENREVAPSGPKKTSPATGLAPEIQFELERILSSKFFRGSKRCQAFLKYVVEAACSGTPDDIKERTLGVVLWGRPPDYDTGADAIVRVKANEMRKRLAQYDLAADPERTVIITLQPGSYVPQISIERFMEPVLEPVPEPALRAVQIVSKPRRVPLAALITIGVVGALVLIMALVFHATSPASPISQFWEPVVRQGEPIICTASPSIYRPTPSALLNASDVNVAFRVRTALQGLGRSSRIGKADDVTLSDLKATPVVLIGGPLFNHWTMWMTKDLRFTLKTVDNKRRVVDLDNPSRFWEDQISSTGKRVEEYVIVTRLLHSTSGQPMISVAGSGPYGSEAGSRFITDASLFQDVLKYAPDNWAHENLQLVLKTKVDAGVPNMPELVAATYW